MDVCWGLWLMRSTLDHFCHCNLVPGPIPISHAINYNTLWYLVPIIIHFDPSLFFLVWFCVEYIVVFQSIDALVSAAKRVVRSLDPFCDVYVWCAWNWSYNRTDVTRGIAMSQVNQKTEIASEQIMGSDFWTLSRYDECTAAPFNSCEKHQNSKRLKIDGSNWLDFFPVPFSKNLRNHGRLLRSVQSSSNLRWKVAGISQPERMRPWHMKHWRPLWSLEDQNTKCSHIGRFGSVTLVLDLLHTGSVSLPRSFAQSEFNLLVFGKVPLAACRVHEGRRNSFH